jgi:hypothetical protein
MFSFLYLQLNRTTKTNHREKVTDASVASTDCFNKVFDAIDNGLVAFGVFYAAGD